MALRILGFIFFLILSTQPQLGFANNVKIGSSYEKVIATLGKPDGELSAGKKQILTYGEAQIVLHNNKVSLVSHKTKELLMERKSKQSSASGKRKQLSPKQQLPHATAGSWITDFSKASAIAKKENKKMLLNFTGSDWCGWCIRLEEEVFSRKEFIAYARENYVLVKLDFPLRKRQPYSKKKQNNALGRKYGIRGYPTIVVLHPSGKVHKKGGYVRGGPEAFLASIR